MTSSSLRRTSNIRRLVAALARHSLGPAEAAQLLQVSRTAARNYLAILEQAGIADVDPARRSRLRLNPDPSVVQLYLDALTENAAPQRVALRRSPSRHCVDPGERFLHVLRDDVRFPLDLSRRPAGRDPLVAALFGPGSQTAA
jgi:hypothetical protein